MHLAVYVGLLDRSLHTLAEAFREVADGHRDEADVHHLCTQLASRVDAQAAALAPVADRYGEHPEAEPDRLHAAGMEETRQGPLGLLRDLQDLALLTHLADLTWTVVEQAAQGLRDHELMEVVAAQQPETSRQAAWLRTRIKQAAPQVLIAAD